jgi:hypothetical protein
MINKLSIFALVAFLALSLAIPQAFAFDINAINVTLADAQVDEYESYDIITAIFSIFNGDSQNAHFVGQNMLYLNDTNTDWWEYSNHYDLEGYSETDCPVLDTVISPGNTTNVQLCYLVQHDVTIGYSVIANNHEGLMDMDIKETILESVPQSFKSTAGDWCSDVISESAFTNSTQSAILNGTINVMKGQSGTDIGTATPSWVKTTACNWSNNLISDYEFLDGLYWMIDNGKIQLE